MKYKIQIITDIKAYPTNSSFSDEKTSKKDEVIRYLEDGYEIYKALPYHTQTVAGIEYILRKEISE